MTIKAPLPIKTDHVRLVSNYETITISPCKGGSKSNFIDFQKSFSCYIDPGFKNWGLPMEQPNTEAIEVCVYYLYKDTNFKLLFDSFGLDLKNLAFNSQEQIQKFYMENTSLLESNILGIFFLLKQEIDNKEVFFIVEAKMYLNQLIFDLYRLSYYFIWPKEETRYLVVPYEIYLD